MAERKGEHLPLPETHVQKSTGERFAVFDNGEWTVVDFKPKGLAKKECKPVLCKEGDWLVTADGKRYEIMQVYNTHDQPPFIVKDKKGVTGRYVSLATFDGVGNKEMKERVRLTDYYKSDTRVFSSQQEAEQYQDDSLKEGGEVIDESLQEELEEIESEVRKLHWDDLKPLTPEEILILREEKADQALFPGEFFIQKNGVILTVDEIRKAKNNELYYEITIGKPSKLGKAFTCLSYENILDHLEKHKYEREDTTPEAAPELPLSEAVEKTKAKKEKVLEQLSVHELPVSVKSLEEIAALFMPDSLPTHNVSWEDLESIKGKRLKSFIKEFQDDILPGQIWKNQNGEEMNVGEVRIHPATKNYYFWPTVRTGTVAIKPKKPQSPEEVKDYLKVHGFTIFNEQPVLQEDDFRNLAVALKGRKGDEPGSEPVTVKQETEKESKLAVGQVYSYQENGKIKYILILGIKSNQVRYKEYNPQAQKWVQQDAQSQEAVEKAIANKNLILQSISPEAATLRADNVKLMGYYIANAVPFVPTEFEPGSAEEKNQDICVKVEHYFERTQRIFITSLNPKVKSRTDISVDDFLSKYRRVLKKSTTVKPQVSVKSTESLVEQPLAQVKDVPEGEGENSQSADITTEAGREVVAHELCALVETNQRVTYVAVLDEDVKVQHSNGKTNLKAGQLAMFSNQDTQMLYETMKQRISNDFEPTIFTVYQGGNLRIWALQRFTEDQKGKFLTHIFEIENFLRLPKEELPEAVRVLQKDLTLAENPEWQEIFWRAMETLGDNNASEWVKRIEAIETAKSEASR